MTSHRPPASPAQSHVAIARSSLLLGAIAALFATLPQPVIAQAGPAFSTQRLSDEDRMLASDAFEGRGPATPAEDKVIAYVSGEMKAAGLEPGGDIVGGKRTWTQKVPLLRAAIGGTPAISIKAGANVMQLTQGKEITVRAALTGQRAVGLTAVPLVFVGYGVTAPEKKWDEFKTVDVRGKIIVVLINDPDIEARPGSEVDGVFGGKAMTYYGRWTYKYEEAARRGAAGVLIVHETGPAAYGWGVVKNSNSNAQFDIVRKDPRASHTPFEAWIQRDVAVKLFAASGLDFEAMKRQAQTRGFTPVPLKAALSASYPVDAAVITSHNIVGLLPGTTRPDETVIYSAHWDHLGIGTPDAEGDRIYNGAVDNADGTAALIEMSRAFAAAPRTKRSIVFLNVTAEEKGLLGSEYYAQNPLYPAAKTAGVLNMDALSLTGGPAHNFSISGTAKLDLLDMLVTEGKARGRSFSPDPHPEHGGFYRSDHFSFAKVGVPAISFESGNDLVTGGVAAGEARSADYTANRYHQPSDEWTPALDFSGVADDLGLLYAVGRQLADGNAWPNWSSGSEFRGTRDKSAAERREAQAAP